MSNSAFAHLALLDGLTSALMGGAGVEMQPIAGEVPVLRVSIEGRDELPIYITVSELQTLCLCHLWSEEEVLPARRAELLEAMLDLNPSIPLSAFGRVHERYMLVGALPAHARVEDVAHEVATLSDNALDALQALAEYLK